MMAAKLQKQTNMSEFNVKNFIEKLHLYKKEQKKHDFTIK